VLQGSFEEGRKTVRTAVGRHGRRRSVGHVIGPGEMVKVFGRRPATRTSCSSQICRAVRHRLTQGKIDRTK